jgi:putative tricarboxylic transport membrane protein
MMEMWLQGFLVAFEGTNLLFLVVGTVFGLVVGALPGLGPMFAVSLALPLTYGMPAASAIILLAAIHASTSYGDSFASILINTPGGPTSVASCWDGFPLAQRGKAGFAMGVSTGGALTGGVIGWLSLVLIAPLLAELSMGMGPAEYFMVGVLALSLLSMASEGETIKGMILGAFGLLISFIGRDPITATKRFTWGIVYLEDGLPLAVVFVGLFALSQIIILAEGGGSVTEVRESKGGVLHGISNVLRHPMTIIRSGLIGVLMGIMPALGPSTANVVSYLVEKRSSNHPETFGQGEPAGLLAPEVAKSSCIIGDLIPTFTLGVPGSGVTALFLAALILHGIQPGPDFFSKGVLPYAVFAGILLAQFTFFLMGLGFAGKIAKVVLVPNIFLAPAVVVLCFFGAFAVRNFLADILITLVFGVVGFVLYKCKWPLPCMVLGFVLGDILESNFHRTLIIGHGSLAPFVTRPIPLLLLAACMLFLCWPTIAGLVFRRRRRGGIFPAALDDEVER